MILYVHEEIYVDFNIIHARDLQLPSIYLRESVELITNDSRSFTGSSSSQNPNI